MPSRAERQPVQIDSARHLLLPLEVRPLQNATPWRAEEGPHQLVDARPIADLDPYLYKRYGPMGNRFPSRTIDVLTGHETDLLEALLGPDGALGWCDPRRPAIIDRGRTKQMQAEADAADLGDLTQLSEGAFAQALRRQRTKQHGVATEGFLAYGRICAACGDDHPWRIQFAHLVPYGRAETERWFVGIPLCGNHHADLDAGRLILGRDYKWRTRKSVPTKSLGVTAKAFNDYIKSGLRPPKHVIAAYLARKAGTTVARGG